MFASLTCQQFPFVRTRLATFRLYADLKLNLRSRGLPAHWKRPMGGPPVRWRKKPLLSPRFGDHWWLQHNLLCPGCFTRIWICGNREMANKWREFGKHLWRAIVQKCYCLRYMKRKWSLLCLNLRFKKNCKFLYPAISIPSSSHFFQSFSDFSTCFYLISHTKNWLTITPSSPGDI